VPIGTPTKDSPFSGTGTFVPHVIVRNLTAAAQAVAITVEYPGEDGPAQATLPPLALEAYTTKDIPLDSVLGSLPLPLPFCSIRIQYSGAPGSAIGEVSSVEAKGDLVIDSRLANERDGWVGSGAHPWHLDEETESILFLTNMSEKSARIGFDMVAGGVHYYLTRLKLKPHETRAIDLRKVRDDQKPDLKGNKVPVGASDGSVVWIRLDHVPVMGRLVVLQRHKSMASSYDCYICDCDPDFIKLDVVPSSWTLLPDESALFDAYALFQEQCGGYQWWEYVSPDSWTSRSPNVATINDGGVATGHTGGTATIVAILGGFTYTYDHYYMECIEHLRIVPGYGTAKVVTITGPQTVWWFNGQNPSGYTTSIQLTANPAGQSQYTWAFSAGSDKATFSGQSGNTINLSGQKLSTSTGDVKVKVTVNGVTSWDYAITVRGPYNLVPGYAPNNLPPYQDTASSSNGYLTYANYTIQDNFSTPLPYSVPLNENWTTSVAYDFSGANWARGNPGGYATSSGAPAGFADHISGPPVGQNNIPAPTSPQSPLSGTKVFHWGQEWRIGTLTPGLGARVQTDSLQYYDDHGRHLNIVSPAP